MRQTLPGILLLILLLIIVRVTAAVPPVPEQDRPIVPTRIPTEQPQQPPPNADNNNDRPPPRIHAVFPITPGTTIEIGDAYEATIEGGQYAFSVRFDGRAGQAIDVVTDTEDGQLDTFLILLAPDGREISRNDDPRVNYTDAAIYDVTLPATGTYTVVITRYGQRFSETEGTFTVYIDEAGSNEFEPSRTSTLISYGVTQTGTIDDSYDYRNTYAFFGEAGDVVEISMETQSPSLDPTLRLTDNAGNEIYVNEDINYLFDFDASIQDFRLPYTGYFTIITEGYGDSVGDYELSVELIESAPENYSATETLAVMNRQESRTLLERQLGLLTTGFLIGDYVPQEMDDEEPEVQTILAFQLPPNLPDVESATLDLTSCTQAGLGFDAISGYNVYEDSGIRSLNSRTAFNPGDEAQVVGSFSECSAVDVTKTVIQAAEENNGSLQFRIVPQSSDKNDQTDAVIFLDPRLSITHAPE